LERSGFPHGNVRGKWEVDGKQVARPEREIVPAVCSETRAPSTKLQSFGRAGSPLPAAGGASVLASRLVRSLAPPGKEGAQGIALPAQHGAHGATRPAEIRPPTDFRNSFAVCLHL
jgi:hypothetical protein